MKRVLFSIILFAVTGLVVSAQRSDIVITTNGNTYEGYISFQNPGHNLKIHSFKTTMTVSGKDARYSSKYMTFGDLLEENHKNDYLELFPRHKDESQVKCASIYVKNADGQEVGYHDSVILEDGDELKFVSFEPMEFDLEWSSIKTLAKVPANFEDAYGVYDVLTLPNGESFKGQLIEQNLKSKIIKFRDFKDDVQTFKKNRVLSIKTAKIDEEKSIWDQAPFLDRIFLKNGKELTGIIYSKVYGESISFLEKDSDMKSEYKLSEIKTYEKMMNSQYVSPSAPAITGPTPSLVINGNEYQTFKLVSKNGKYKVDQPADSVKFSCKAGENIFLELKAATRTSKVKMAMARTEKIQLVEVSKGRHEKQGYSTILSFKQFEVFENPDINFISNNKEYITAELSFDKPGYYVLFIEGDELCVVFNITEK